MVLFLRRYLFLFVLAAAAALFLICGFFFGNNTLTIKTYELQSGRVSGTITVVHLSDLHNKSFGEDNAELIDDIKKQNPDIIVDSGDLLTSGQVDANYMDNLETKLTSIAPVYFVTGNHEWKAGQQEKIVSRLRSLGVTVLRSDIKTISVRGSALSIGGIDDIRHLSGSMDRVLSDLSRRSGYRIFIMHEPQVFDTCAQYDIDLVLSGHTHGGQIALPFIGALYAANQGFFPPYASGLHTKNGVSLIVSNGVGNGALPIRINVPPQIVVVKISQK